MTDSQNRANMLSFANIECNRTLAIVPFLTPKQPVLKPQDLVVAIKVALGGDRMPSYARLGQELCMSASEVHAAVRRCVASRLLTQSGEWVEANRASILEFLLHGAGYAFPLSEASVTRGLPTGAYAPALQTALHASSELPLVWPCEQGTVRGRSVTPLYPRVPEACLMDASLYAALAAVDALRGGAAREREVAKSELTRWLR